MRARRCRPLEAVQVEAVAEVDTAAEEAEEWAAGGAAEVAGAAGRAE